MPPCVPRRQGWSWLEGPLSLGFLGKGPSRFCLLQRTHPGHPSALPGSPAFLAPHRGGRGSRERGRGGQRGISDAVTSVTAQNRMGHARRHGPQTRPPRTLVLGERREGQRRRDPYSQGLQETRGLRPSKLPVTSSGRLPALAASTWHHRAPALRGRGGQDAGTEGHGGRRGWRRPAEA